MSRAAMVAAGALAFLSASLMVYVGITHDKDELSLKERFWCREYLGAVRSEREVQRWVSWADAAIFSREFGKEDFRLGHFSGPRKAGHTLDTRKDGLRLPGWMPAHYEVRVLGESGSEFSSVFITGGRYKGLVVVRETWDEALDGRHLVPDMIKARSGRLGLICYVD